MSRLAQRRRRGRVAAGMRPRDRLRRTEIEALRLALDHAAAREQLLQRSLDAARGLAALLAQVNQVITTAADETHMLREVCALAVAAGGFALAWIGVPDPDGWFRVVASSGAPGYLEQVRTSIDPALDEGLGCMGRAWRSDEAQFNASILGAGSMRPWKELARHHGLAAVAALPVHRAGEVWGVLAVYHRSEGIFDAPTRAVLQQLALGLSRGIDRIALDALRRHHDLLHQTLLDNAVAGVTMTQGNRIVSANARFAEMLGYSSVDDLAGQPTLSLYADGAEFQRIHDLYPQLHATGSAQLLSVHLACRDGRLISCDIAGRLLPQPHGKPIVVWTVVDVTQRDEQTEMLRQLQADAAFRAQHDTLTGLPNRYALQQYLPRVIADAQHQGSGLVVAWIDLDDFKPVNDTFGHGAGDLLLQQFAQRVKALMRGSDFIARVGGDEFVAVLRGFDSGADWDSALAAIRRLHASVEAPFELAAGRCVSLGLSLGAARYPDDGQDAHDLLGVADAAMYRAKSGKGTRTLWWSLGRDAASPACETGDPGSS